jgi:hypothetical protein
MTFLDGLPSITISENGAYGRHLGEHQPCDSGTPAGSLEKEPSAQCSHRRFSVNQETTGVGGEDRGYDGGKKVKGRKRHLLVDTEGFVLKVKVHSAKVMDYEGIKTLLRKADE